jgi:hypothetical protein
MNLFLDVSSLRRTASWRYPLREQLVLDRLNSRRSTMKSEIQITNFDIDALRARLSKMSDVELIRFGKDARYMCSPWANMNTEQGNTSA